MQCTRAHCIAYLCFRYWYTVALTVWQVAVLVRAVMCRLLLTRYALCDLQKWWKVGTSSPPAMSELSCVAHAQFSLPPCKHRWLSAVTLAPACDLKDSDSVAAENTALTRSAVFVVVGDRKGSLHTFKHADESSGAITVRLGIMGVGKTIIKVGKGGGGVPTIFNWQNQYFYNFSLCSTALYAVTSYAHYRLLFIIIPVALVP